MDNTQKLCKMKVVVRIVGGFFVLIGLYYLFSVPAYSVATRTSNCVFPVGLLMVIGGCLLIGLRRTGFEIVFIILRFFVLTGLLAVIGVLITRQFSDIIYAVILLAVPIGLMIFLSRSSTKINPDQEQVK